MSEKYTLLTFLSTAKIMSNSLKYNVCHAFND